MIKTVIKSPLTNSKNVRYIKDINVEEINIGYKKNLGININHIFSGLKKISLYKCLESRYKFFAPFDIGGDSYFYEQLQRLDWYYNPWKWEHETAKKFIKDGMNILEIGCAKGDFLQKIKENYHIDIFGIELNKSAVKSLNRKNIPNSSINVESFALQNPEKFDMVCCFQVLEHVAHVQPFIMAMTQCLKKNGKLIISVPNNDSFLKHDKSNLLNMPPHHMGRWNKKSLIYLSKLFNLKVLSIQKEPLQSYHISWYTNVVLNIFFKTIFLKKLADKLGIRRFLEFLTIRFQKRIIGHTILIVLQK